MIKAAAYFKNYHYGNLFANQCYLNNILLSSSFLPFGVTEKFLFARTCLLTHAKALFDLAFSDLTVFSQRFFINQRYIELES